MSTMVVPEGEDVPPDETEADIEPRPEPMVDATPEAEVDVVPDATPEAEAEVDDAEADAPVADAPAPDDAEADVTPVADATPEAAVDAAAGAPEVDDAAPDPAVVEVAPEDLLPIGSASVDDEPLVDNDPAVELDPSAALPVGPEAEPAPEAVAEPEVAPEADADAVDEVIGEDELVYEKDDDAPAVRVQSPYDKPGRWFVVHTQSGYEKKVKQNLEARTLSMDMEGRIHEVVIPMEDVVEFKGGKKVVVQKKVFPGYLLVRCDLDDDAWYVIRNTPGVTGFVGQGSKPSPLSRGDVETFLAVKVEGEDAPKRTKPLLQYEEGETVRVKEGPFADFSGQVVEINEDQLKVKVLVNIFGRETPVELEFAQVAKL